MCISKKIKLLFYNYPIYVHIYTWVPIIQRKRNQYEKKRIQIGFTYSYLSALVYSQFWPMTCSGEAEIRSQLLKKSRKGTQHVETKICFVRVTR